MKLIFLFLIMQKLIYFAWYDIRILPHSKAIAQWPRLQVRSSYYQTLTPWTARGGYPGRQQATRFGHAAGQWQQGWAPPGPQASTWSCCFIGILPGWRSSRPGTVCSIRAAIVLKCLSNGWWPEVGARVVNWGWGLEWGWDLVWGFFYI